MMSKARRRAILAVAASLLVAASPGLAATELSVLTLNVQWNGNWADEDVAHLIASSGADLVGLQEYASSESIRRLARLLGFHAFPEGEILSRYPIVESRGLGHGWAAGVAVVEVDPARGRRVALVNQHLSSYPYSPHDLLDGSLDEAGAVAQEIRTRVQPELSEAMAAVARLRGRGLPTLLVGDFNAPSHLDWRPEHSELNGGHHVVWPMSASLQAMGLADAFRVVHPDRASRPGYTWSVHPEGEAGKHDRIDFVYYAGEIEPTTASIVGEPGSAHTDLAFSPWATDHRAVLAGFRLRDAKGRDKPRLRSLQAAYRGGAPLRFRVRAGEPRSSRLELYREGEFPIRNGPVVWIAADSENGGVVTLEGPRVRGPWPLPAGRYEAYLRSAEGVGSLAAVGVEVAAETELVPPGGLRAAWDAKSVRLSWRNRAVPEHRVAVERRVDRRTWKRLALLPSGARVFRDDDGIDVTNGHLYEYRVSAVDDAGASLPSSIASASARPVLSVSGHDDGADSLTLHFNGGRGRPDDWIAVYPAGAAPAQAEAVVWRYCNGTRASGGARTDGSVFFGALAEGRYDAHLLCCGGYVPEASLAFEVSASHRPSLAVDKSSYHPGEPIRVRFEGGAGHAEDWIGLYRATDDPRTAWYRTWLYANGTQTSGGSHRAGEVVFSEGLPNGTYVVHFLGAGGYASSASTPVFTVDGG